MNKEDVIDNLKDCDLVIWGARMTGLGALRTLKGHGINPVCFVDSDPSFANIKSGGLRVYAPQDLNRAIAENGWKPKILIAVALKEQEIVSVLSKYKVEHLECYSFQDKSAPYFTVDVLSSCNLKCISCPHSIPEHETPGGSMRFETFTDVVDKIVCESPQTSHISLYSWGEPLLHPKIDKMVQYVHSKGLAVALSSNLSFTFDDRLEQLIKAEPDYLKVSLSGYYSDAYNSTHQGGNIDLVKSNLFRLRYYMDKYNAKIVVDINYHLYRNNNQKNLQKFTELAEELGFMISSTYALVMPLERVINHIEGNPDQQTTELHDNLLVTIDEGIEASSKQSKSSDGCPFRENQVNINADLTVPICCTVFSRGANIVSQNFLNSSLTDISKEKSTVSLCQKCEHYRLPEYNLGLNQAGWKKYAEEKSSFDN